MKTLLFAVGLAFAVGGVTVGHAEQLVDEVILNSLRVVEDPDGDTNVRSGPSTQSKIVGQIQSGSVVAIEPEQEGDWSLLTFHQTTEESRFIHNSRLKSLKPWKQFAVTTAAEDDSAGLLKTSGAEIKVTSVPFVAAEHKISKDKDGVYLVDGGPVWGRDGELPAHSMVMTLKLGGKEVLLPKEALQNVYEPFMQSLYLLTPGDPAKQAVVLMVNGDGAGGYCVAWAFHDGAYRGRAIFVPF